MARMHSRKKGKSGSTKPSTRVKPSWLRYTEKEIEMLITKLAKEDKNASEIGIILRDSYGIPDVKTITGKKINKILKDKELGSKIPEDLLSLIKRSINLSKHNEENRKDMTSKKGSQLTDSKIKRLAKYYKSTGVLPMDWKFDKKSIKFYVE